MTTTCGDVSEHAHFSYVYLFTLIVFFQVTGCQKALRHLHDMMFNQSPLRTEPQICNNFARKSIRGFFHDFMSDGIDGSLLYEHDIEMNFGLCRWAQYVPHVTAAPSRVSAFERVWDRGSRTPIPQFLHTLHTLPSLLFT